MFRRVFAMSLAALSINASAANVAIEVLFNGEELPYFGVTSNWIRSALTQKLQAKGHTIVNRADHPNVPFIKAEFAGWSTQMDGGRTTMAKSEGVLMMVQPLQVVSQTDPKKKTSTTETVFAATTYRLCSGLATDDRRNQIQDGIQRCIQNFVIID